MQNDIELHRSSTLPSLEGETLGKRSDGVAEGGKLSSLLVTRFSAEHENGCGLACGRMIASAFAGSVPSEKELGEKIGFDGAGLYEFQIPDLAAACGADFQDLDEFYEPESPTKQDTVFTAIENGLNDKRLFMVALVRPSDPNKIVHLVLLTALDAENAHIIDPSNREGETHKFPEIYTRNELYKALEGVYTFSAK